MELIVIKQFKIPPSEEERFDRINVFLEENGRYQYKTFLEAMELYIKVKNEKLIVMDHESYKHLLVSSDINCKKNKNGTSVQELLNIIQRKAMGKRERPYLFTKRIIAGIAMNMFNCCEGTGYGYFNRLRARGAFISAPEEWEAWYNRKYRVKGKRKLDVYVWVGDPYLTNGEREESKIPETDEVATSLMSNHHNAIPVTEGASE